jgi:hypothetical protein
VIEWGVFHGQFFSRQTPQGNGVVVFRLRLFGRTTGKRRALAGSGRA